MNAIKTKIIDNHYYTPLCFPYDREKIKGFINFLLIIVDES